MPNASVDPAARGPSCASWPFIVADIGGTHARLALVERDAGGMPILRHCHQQPCADYPSLAAALRDFARASGAAPECAAVAIAGLVDGDGVVNTNLPWPVSVMQTARDAGLRHLALVNDFEAVAYAVPHIGADAMTHVCGPIDAEPGPVLVLGPGTGLGAALRLPGKPPTVLPSEAGHAALAAGTVRELALLQHLLQRWPHVDNERVLSGPGLLNAYTGLCAIDGVGARLTTPAAVAAAAQADSDAHAVEAMQLFCGVLGSVAGDLAIILGARAVYLAGGIPAQIKPFLLASDFVTRFCNKGVLAGMLARVPVRLLDHGQLGLMGAAAWYLERHPQP